MVEQLAFVLETVVSRKWYERVQAAPVNCRWIVSVRNRNKLAVAYISPAIVK